VDGLDEAELALIDAKYTSPIDSPWVDGGKKPPSRIKELIRKDADEQMQRYGEILRSGRTPAEQLVVRTNSQAAKRYFEGLMRRHGVPGRVDLVR
jgi:hypothetical protein